MALGDRIQQLEPRERQLLGILLTVFAALLLLALPAGVAAVLGQKRAHNDALRESVSSIQASRAVIATRDKERKDIAQRYANVTPPLASFLEKLASQSQRTARCSASVEAARAGVPEPGTKEAR